MKKIKINKTNTKKRVFAITATGVILLSGIGCANLSTKRKEKEESKDITVNNYEKTSVSYVEENISNLFPELNKDVVKDASLILLLDILAPEDENGKINSDIISNYKSKIDSDSMMSNFNSVLDEIENTIITKNTFISVSSLLPSEMAEDKAILSDIESITSTIMYLVNNGGSKEQIIAEYNKIYALVVENKEVSVNGKNVKVRDLSYSSRAVVNAYARCVGYFVRDYASEKSLKVLDARTNDQNSKPYIKTDLEILSNQMIEKSEVDVIKLFNEKYASVENLLKTRVNVSSETIKDLVNYINLDYLASDKVANKDRNQLVGEYEDSKVSEVLSAIDAINTRNVSNQKDMILFSSLLVDNYKNTESGKIDKMALDYVEYNSIMLLNATSEKSTFTEVYNNPYFQNLYKYFTKQDFVHKYKDETGKVVEVKVVWQGVSDSANLVNNQIINSTLTKVNSRIENNLSKDNKDTMNSFIKKSESNLDESLQYVQNTIAGECFRFEMDGYEFSIKR